jgi:hypothetical protein
LDRVPVRRTDAQAHWWIDRHVLVVDQAHCARVNVNGIRRTKDDYVGEQMSSIFSATTFESLLINVEQLRTRLLQLGCFREVLVIIDKAQGVATGKACASDASLVGNVCTFADAIEGHSYDVTYVTEEHRSMSGGINTAVGQNEGSLVTTRHRHDSSFDVDATVHFVCCSLLLVHELLVAESVRTRRKVRRRLFVQQSWQHRRQTLLFDANTTQSG